MTLDEYVRLLLIERFGAEPPWHERTERPKMPTDDELTKRRRQRALNAAMGAGSPTFRRGREAG